MRKPQRAAGDAAPQALVEQRDTAANPALITLAHDTWNSSVSVVGFPPAGIEVSELNLTVSYISLHYGGLHYGGNLAATILWVAISANSS